MQSYVWKVWSDPMTADHGESEMVFDTIHLVQQVGQLPTFES